MEQDKNLDIQLWKQTKERIDNDKPNLEHEDFITICKLHAKYKKHKYIEISFCGCNKKQIHQWIKEVDECLA
mgnify:CR=1 FL=1